MKQVLFLFTTISFSYSFANQALVTAVQNDNYQEAVRILETDTTVNVEEKVECGTLLHYVIPKKLKGDFVNLLINHKANVNARTDLRDGCNGGETPLMYAVYYNGTQNKHASTLGGVNGGGLISADFIDASLRDLKSLLDHGADPNAQAFNDNTPLNLISKGPARNNRSHYEEDKECTPPNVIDQMRTQVTQLLLEAGANIQLPVNKSVFLDFFNELTCIDTERIKHALKFKPDVNVKNADNKTALWYAVSEANFEVVKALIDAKALVDVPDNKKGMTPLIKLTKNYFARESGASAIAKLLIQKGAKLSAIDKEGKTALHHFYSDGELLRTLIAAGNKKIFNIQDKAGFTPLMNLASAGEAEAVKLLVKLGADWNLMGNNGWKAYTLAVSRLIAITDPNNKSFQNYKTITDLLISKGAEVNNVFSCPENLVAPCYPLRMAIGRYKNEAAVDYLISKGADVNEIPYIGYAVYWNVPLQIVEKLLKAGANPNALGGGKHNNLPLFDLIRQLRDINDDEAFIMSAIPLLVKYGADINAYGSEYDYKGKTLLMYSAWIGNINLVKLFISLGADKKLKGMGPGFSGLTAYDIAVRAGHTAIAQELKP